MNLSLPANRTSRGSISSSLATAAIGYPKNLVCDTALPALVNLIRLAPLVPLISPRIAKQAFSRRAGFHASLKSLRRRRHPVQRSTPAHFRMRRLSWRRPARLLSINLVPLAWAPHLRVRKHGTGLASTRKGLIHFDSRERESRRRLLIAPRSVPASRAQLLRQQGAHSVVIRPSRKSQSNLLRSSQLASFSRRQTRISPSLLLTRHPASKQRVLLRLRPRLC